MIRVNQIWKARFFAVVLLAAPAVVMGCAHAEVEKDLNAKLAAEPAVAGSTNLHDEADRILTSENTLTDAQKNEMRTLWNSTETKMDRLHELSLRLRALLTKSVVSRGSQSDIKRIETKLADVEQRRLEEYFSAVRDTNRLLGRWGSAGPSDS